MGIRDDVIGTALGELGYKAYDDPLPGSKYARWYYYNIAPAETWLLGSSSNVWWCNMYVSYVLYKAGARLPGYPSYNTDNSISCNRLIDIDDALPGDLVYYDWDNDGSTDHVGIILDVDHENIMTIEGNVSNSVAKCMRDRYDHVYGVVSLDQDADHCKLTIDGILGYMTTRRLQEYLSRHGYYNGDIDGYIDNLGYSNGHSMTIEALQRYLNNVM